MHVELFGLPSGYGVGYVVAQERGAAYLLYQPIEGVLTMDLSFCAVDIVLDSVW